MQYTEIPLNRYLYKLLLPNIKGSMKSKEQLWDVCMDIYRDLYKQSTPVADFDELIRSGITKQPMWFMDYTISLKKTEEIMQTYYHKHKLSKHEKQHVLQEVYLGCAPKFE